MALRLAMSHPGRFAGVISLCGAFPTGGTPFGNLVAARRLGMFLATGRGSREYPAAQVCEDLRLLHTAGLSITLRQYPCGHELMPQMLADVDRWIMEQINPPPAPDRGIRRRVVARGRVAGMPAPPFSCCLALLAAKRALTPPALFGYKLPAFLRFSVPKPVRTPRGFAAASARHAVT